jgi:hypothetical protein
MKNWISTFAGACLLAFSLVACVKDVKEAETPSPEPITSETIAKIAALGFSTENVQRVDDGYLVEGDIILTDAELDHQSSSPNLLIAQEEQYRTYNLVTGLPRAITVSVSGTVPSGFIEAVDAAIARYNAENLRLTFSRVSSNGNINISLVKSRQYIASAGFPSNTGQPYSQIKYSTAYAGTNYSLGFKTTVIAHEMGHCIGFRHTDYMNRSFSCGGSGGNEGSGTVGAVHIPGTPTGPDKASWMLSCLSATTNRPFNNNDKTALSYLY